ncbi:MAG: HlyC/CorC family transporter [Chloroflexi bacterium]|nr:HlyC/CorC family transporter [Chloroflexota bacterium]
MAPIALEIIFILLLILANGLLAMAEMAVIAARKTRLQARADEGDRGAQAALELAGAPDRFLSTVQAGITLVGILAGVISGATITDELAALIAQAPGLEPFSRVLAVAIVVATVTYLSLVLGELVPKQIALLHAERIAAAVAPAMQALERLSAPLVHLLSASTRAVSLAIGVRPGAGSGVTEDDVRQLVAQGADAGVIERSEQQMVERVFRLGDRTVSALMTPRADVVALDLADTPDEIRAKLSAHNHSRFPVTDGGLDHVVGLAYARDLLAQLLGNQPVDLRAAVRPALYLPDTLPALSALERFRAEHSHVACVVDEYGTVQGVISITDLMESVVGDIRLPEEGGAGFVRRADGSFLIDGSLPADELRDVLGITHLPGAGGYQTIGGLMMGMLQRVPAAGDYFDAEGFRFEVADMDGRRVDKVLIAPRVG